jgi:hypothetical protein
MLYRANYVTDTGETYFFASLSVLAKESFLPEIFKSNSSQSAGFCAFPRTVRPREALLWDASGEGHKIQYPFQPGTPEWLDFWNEINQNPEIVTNKNIGERIQLNLRNS